MRQVKVFALTPHENCRNTSTHLDDDLSDAREAEEA
jgi:hypothetical protein